jgi:cobalt-zinc-cadmium efflux system protein
MSHSHGAHAHDGRHARANEERPLRSGHATVHGDPSPGVERQERRLRLVLLIVSSFFLVEVLGAIAANSVVLQADALHLLADVLALGVSLFAMRVAVREPTPRFTFGLRRAEPVAAIFSALLVLATTAGIVIEGIGALRQGTPPRAGVMIAVAVAALAVNGLSAWLLQGAMFHGHAPDRPSKEHGHALNLRGAWLHLLGDTLAALAALIAALVIRFGGHPAADPIASFAVAAVLLFGSLRLLRDATLVLLEAAPSHLPVAAIRQIIAEFPGVSAVHDLHIWSLGAGHEAVTVHVHADSRDPELGQRLSERLRTGLAVEYVTVQVDVGERACAGCSVTHRTEQ